MKILILLFAFCALAYADQRNARLVGGTPANSGQFPSTVAIETPFAVLCNGVIVDQQHVLTAAQCVFNENRRLMDPFWLTIVAGDLQLMNQGARRQTRKVSRINVHPQFNIFTREHDLAVLRLNEPFDLPSNTVDVARRRTSITSIGETCEFAGWGETAGTGTSVNVNQRYFPMVINDRDACNGAAMHAGGVMETMICAGNTAVTNAAAPCHGNMGAGLYCNRELVGTLSFGINCGGANNPPVFTQVRNYRRWIEEQFSETTGLPPNWSPAVL
ncbi:trypsin 3A1-like [Uranotaenia lowii]|uniref:trypsin 3A1-like n=1 Tax=Uranotaenia lowii TaxID=190385 RepID=UPI00247AAAE3|nr:trypsin 3A1-like [Uranotaenia lowii]